jgi:hypothetical protein
MISLASIMAALIYVLATDLQIIQWPLQNQENFYCNLEGLPFFFGIALFMFEGNALALEINH